MKYNASKNSTNLINNNNNFILMNNSKNSINFNNNINNKNKQKSLHDKEEDDMNQKVESLIMAKSINTKLYDIIGMIEIFFFAKFN